MHFLDRVDLWSLLIAHAIQLTCLGGIVCLLVKLFAKNRPHLAHALWALVLLKAITPPVIAPPFPVLEWSFLQESPPAKALLDSPPSPVAPLEKHQVGVWRVVPSQQAGNSSVTDPVASSAIGSPLVSESTKAPERFSLSLAMVLLIVWSLGGGLHLLWKSACLLRFLKRLRPSLGKASARTEALFRTVVEDMKLPQRSASKAEVRTVGLLIGPAVLGLWKPKILLPVVLEQECSEEELRILLAHELTHIRRGDLWWAAVQTLATSWWWFHPLIRLCNRWFERAAEMSCDEETIARLGCKPQAYARSLLKVLERKHQLQAAPTLPGVRPVDVTLKRMERIMKLNQGLARRSAPWWVLGLLVTAAMFILPSAAGLSLAQEGEDPPGDKAANTTPKPSAEWKPVVAQSMPLASISSPWIPDQVVETLDAEEAVAYFQQEQGMSPMQAATALASHLRGYAQGATVIVKDGEAIVQGQQEQIDATKRELERIREHGLSTQIRVDATVSHIPQAMFEQISANWQMMPRKSPELPVLSALVSREFEAQLAALFLQHSSAVKLSEPKIMTLNGRSVEIANGTEHPFVVVPASANDRKGEVQFEMDGFNLEVCPVLAGRVMELDVRFVNSRIEGVQQFTFESVGDAERKTVQVPQVAEQRLECKVTVPLHQILLFAIPDPNKEGQFTLLSLNPTPVGNPKELDVKVQPALEPAIASSFPPQTYGINPAYTLASSPAIEPLQSSDVVRRPSPPNPQYSGYPAVGELQPLPTPADATVAWAQTATPYAALQTGAVSQEYWFFKCDGPPVAEEIQERCNEVFEAFHIRPSLEGSWELDDAADSIVLKGQNFALSCPGGDLFRFDCPSGQMNVHPASKRFEIVADDSCDVQATIDTKFLVEAKRIAFTDEGMDATGTKFKLMIETTDGQKELQGTAESLQHDGDGIRLTQAEILVDDIKAQASEVVLMDTKLLFNGEARLVRPQESGQPMHLQADYLDLDLNTDRVSIGEQ